MSVQCGLFDCTIDYTGSTLANATMVTLTGSEDFIDHCIFKQQPISQGGPTGCVGISIGSASTVYVTNTHISDFDYGIEIPGGGVNLQHALFSGINCQSNVTGLTIKPASNSGTIYELFFVNCVFARTSDSTSATPGILIDTNGGASTNVSDICFANCMSHDWAGPGMQINAGQDIVVTGGRYGMDATDNSMTTSGAIRGHLVRLCAYRFWAPTALARYQATTRSRPHRISSRMESRSPVRSLICKCGAAT